ncbi:MAG: hypothetical protein U1E25_16265 [Methylocystis sp.]
MFLRRRFAAVLLARGRIPEQAEDKHGEGEEKRTQGHPRIGRLARDGFACEASLLIEIRSHVGFLRLLRR